MHNQHEQNRDPSDHLQILVLTPLDTHVPLIGSPTSNSYNLHVSPNMRDHRRLLDDWAVPPLSNLPESCSHRSQTRQTTPTTPTPIG